MPKLDSYFTAAIEKGASDVHLVAGARPCVRIEGVLTAVGAQALTSDALIAGLAEYFSKDQMARFEDSRELDAAVAIGGERFRVNLHFQMGAPALAARRIPKKIPAPDELYLPEVVNGFAAYHDGLVLVTGPSGSGKSTTLASLIEEINQNSPVHIVTIEDPIEFVFESKKALVIQREVGSDTHSFASALSHVLRQDPNVILIGEMRDPETIAAALTAAETGHLVFSTLHTSSAAEAVERIVDVFEGARQQQVLIQLASVLRAVAAQRLLPGTDGRRVAAREILVSTPAVQNLIRENHVAQIASVIQTGAKEGMISMRNAVVALAAQGKIGKEVGAQWSR